jgi:hypothetical protein
VFLGKLPPENLEALGAGLRIVVPMNLEGLETIDKVEIAIGKVGDRMPESRQAFLVPRGPLTEVRDLPDPVLQQVRWRTRQDRCGLRGRKDGRGFRKLLSRYTSFPSSHSVHYGSPKMETGAMLDRILTERLAVAIAGHPVGWYALALS